MKYALLVCVFFVACKAECKLGGGEDVSAHVDCKVKDGPTVECTVQQTKGKSEIEVCWDFAARCPNGATLTAERSCQKVKDGSSVTSTTPKEKVTVSGPCDGSPTATMSNMTINGKSTAN